MRHPSLRAPERRSTTATSAPGLLALAGAISGGTALAAPTFTPLGELSGGQYYSEACGVSSDGHVVVGASVIDGNFFFGATVAAFRWDAQSGMQQIYSVGINTNCTAYAANSDGTVIVGAANHASTPANTQAFIWTSLGVSEIGDLPGGNVNAAARGVSEDGAVLAGAGESGSGPEGFRYTTSDSTFVGLGDLPDGPFNSAAFGISADGTTLVGTSYTGDQNSRLAFRWTQSGGIQSLGHLGVPEGIVPLSEAYAASADGSVIVGMSRSPLTGNQGWEAFRWTQESGMVGLGDIPGDIPFAIAFATSADGSVVVGRGHILDCNTPVGCITVYRAFIWDAVNGTRDLNTVLTDLGVNLIGWKLTEARGISANGRVIVGNATNPQGNQEAWRVEFEFPGCPADFNGDAQVDFFDYLDFVAAFDQDDPAADFNGDTQVDFFDYLDFASAFDSCS